MKATTFFDHLRELRKRLIWSIVVWVLCAILAYCFYIPLLDLLSAPLESVTQLTQQKQLFYVNSVFEGFATRVDFSLIFGVILSFPFHVYQFIRFVFPGLTKKERTVMLWMVFSSAILGAFSLYYTYAHILPASVKFLMDLEFVPRQVGILLKYDQGVFHILRFLLFGVLVFQFPVVLELMLYLNIVSRAVLLKYARFVIVFIFVLAAFVAPPDVISQLGIAFPLIALFYLTIFIAKLFKFGES
jgi:sec-independent protein translocase protein TatC